MINHAAVPFLFFVLLLLPLPFLFLRFLIAVPLAVRPRGEPDRAGVVISRFAAPTLLRGPPR
jgi:hypothetical protein